MAEIRTLNPLNSDHPYIESARQFRFRHFLQVLSDKKSPAAVVMRARRERTIKIGAAAGHIYVRTCVRAYVHPWKETKRNDAL